MSPFLPLTMLFLLWAYTRPTFFCDTVFAGMLKCFLDDTNAKPSCYSIEFEVTKNFDMELQLIIFTSNLTHVNCIFQGSQEKKNC